MLDPDDILRRRGQRLYGAGDAELGTIEAVFLDDAEDRPTWALVDADGGRRFVPLDGVAAHDEGLEVPHDAAHVASAPAVGSTDRLSPDDEVTLRRHYAGGSTDGGAERDDPDRGDPDRGGDAAPVVVRHEEQLRVRTTATARRVRVRKEIVTEHRQVTIPVRREVLRVEEVEGDAGRVPVPDGDAAPPEPLELVLHEEEVVVTTTVVPKERVRIDVRRTESSRPVGADVRRERVEMTGPDTGTGSPPTT